MDREEEEALVKSTPSQSGRSLYRFVLLPATWMTLCATAIIVLGLSYLIDGGFPYATSPKLEGLVCMTATGPTGPQSPAPITPADPPPPRQGTYRHFRPWEDWAMPAVRYREGRRMAAKQELDMERRRNRRALTVMISEELEIEFMTRLHENQFPSSCDDRPILIPDSHISSMASNFHQHRGWMELALATNWTLVPAGQMGVESLFGGCEESNRNFGCYFNVTHCMPNMPLGASRKEEINKAYEGPSPHSPCDTFENQIVRDEMLASGTKIFRLPPQLTDCTARDRWRRAYIDTWASKGWLSRANGDAIVNASCLSYAEQKMLMSSLITRFMFSPTEAVKTRARHIIGQSAWEPPVVAVEMQRGDHAMEDRGATLCHHSRPVSAYYEVVKIEEVFQGSKFKSTLLMSDDPNAYSEFIELTRKNKVASPHNEVLPKEGSPTFIYDRSNQAGVLDVNLDYLAMTWLAGEIAEFAVGMVESSGGRLLWEILTAEHRLLHTTSSSGPVFEGVDENWTPFYW